MNVLKFITTTLVQSALNSTGTKVGEALGGRLGDMVRGKDHVPEPHWSWTLYHNISLAVMATLVKETK